MSGPQTKVPAIPINLPELATGDDGKNYRLLSRIDGEPSRFLRSERPINTPRQRAFQEMVGQIAGALGSTMVPLSFRMPNGKARKLDEGCVGHAIANGMLFPPGYDGGDPAYVRLRRPSAATDQNDYAGQEVERQKRWGEIASRPKQYEFSAAIRRNYGGRCAVTGCCTPAALQAAHIRVSDGLDFNADDNGILFRSDIHALLDALLITFSPDGKTFEISPVLQDKSYDFLRSCKIRRPVRGSPLSVDNIEHHRKRFRCAVRR